nr:MAG TPA: hypothetical protein [Caudoviricetes sp.]
MSKAVLISIRPKRCEKIANGEKTIEVRKTRPKLDTPFRCYIYCTIDGIKKMPNDYIAESVDRGKVIGEFTCERIAPITYDGGRLWCPTNAAFSPATCLSQAEIIAYIGDKGRCYGWHISDLLIYDQPRELTAFRRLCPNDLFCEACAMYSNNNGICNNGALPLRRPPQSWCYVEAMKNA